MKPIAELNAKTAKAIKVVFADIDDTITTEGRLYASAYQALENLAEAGIAVAPITGRPAGWADMIARFWPVKGVVGENGAFYYAYSAQDKKMLRKSHPEFEAHAANLSRFDRILERINAEIPAAAISADQPFRMADLAIDFCEDIPPLPEKDVIRIKEIFEEEGGIAKISSIHVNGWFGEYDKLTMSRIFAHDILGLDIDKENEACIFVGDSPNDAPMFGFFENSCGVANVKHFKTTLSAPPKYVAQHEGGEGFCEIVTHLLNLRE